ncbi:MAG: DUF2127 domain-containing protein [Candidatus Dormibacteria bacterium]
MPTPGRIARFRRELGRRTGPLDWVLRYLVVERGAKGVVLLGLAVFLLLRRDNLAGLADQLEAQLNLDAGSGVVRATLERATDWLGAVRPSLAVQIAGAATLYGLLELTESVGLALRRRWAEYLTALATAFFVPFEAYELAVRLTVFRLAALLVNVAAVVYLVWRKRLFAGGGGE